MSLSNDPLHLDPEEVLIQVSQRLSFARTIGDVSRIVGSAARRLAGADGASVVLREGDLCHYVDEDSISPLWKGRRFPAAACISGWSILHGQTAIVPDIRLDERIPQDAYKPTFVRSLVMVPIRELEPLGAIGVYWSDIHRPSPECVESLRSLANLVSIAVENVRLIAELTESNLKLEQAVLSRDRFLSIASHELRTPLTSLKLRLELMGRPQSSWATDLDRALRAAWLGAAATRGWAPAQYAYGMLALYGVGLPENKGRGAQWIIEAARQNHAPAYFMIGELYRHGWGRPRDEQKARLYYERAKEVGDERAEIRLSTR